MGLGLGLGLGLGESAHHWSVAPAVLALHVKAALWPHCLGYA